MFWNNEWKMSQTSTHMPDNGNNNVLGWSCLLQVQLRNNVIGAGKKETKTCLKRLEDRLLVLSCIQIERLYEKFLELMVFWWVFLSIPGAFKAILSNIPEKFLPLVHTCFVKRMHFTGIVSTETFLMVIEISILLSLMCALSNSTVVVIENND